MSLEGRKRWLALYILCFGGYHLGFLVGAIFSAAAAALGGMLLRPAATPGFEGPEPAPTVARD